MLPAVGLGVVDPAEQQAFGVDRSERAAWLDEVVPLLHLLWRGEAVDHDGPRFHYRGLRVQPAAVKGDLDVWLGGRAPSELRRVGRLGDGWLPSFCTPDQAAEGRLVVEKAAADAGRHMDPEHWGALVAYCPGEMPGPLADRLARIVPGTDPAEVVPSGLPALRARLEEFVERSFSKLVVLPVGPAGDDHLTALADAVLDLQV
ncbi:MAG TPA: LLM class flavin-dependent oxidoreductase, partial [Acidimicrobiales bacterium]|nr:LLM class flavin-dependent oxidoreductase [Acidimicrobiales bacterium]